MQKKGFTLIELLAVLVVLAILALIAVPIVISIINNARENSYKRSIESYGRAVETSVGVYVSNNSDVSYSEIGSKYSKDAQKIDNIDIEYSGQPVTCSSLQVGDNGIITLNHCQVLDSNNKPLSRIYNYENKKLTEVIIYTAYSVGDTFNLSGDSYHVISNSGASQDYVVALKDVPLTVEEVSTYGGYSPRYTFYAASWSELDQRDYVSIFYYTSETCGYVNNSWINSGCTNSYNLSDVNYIVDGWVQNKLGVNRLKEVDGYAARLITLEELQNNLGYDSARWLTSGYMLNRDTTPSWVYDNYGYWTMTPKDDSSLEVWRVFSNGEVDNAGHVLSANFIRPVINVYKSAID